MKKKNRGHKYYLQKFSDNCFGLAQNGEKNYKHLLLDKIGNGKITMKKITK